MTKEEAIKILKELAGYEKTMDLIQNYSVSVQDALYMAIKALSSSENPNKSEIMTGWIPVSEGLPKKFSYVNCTCHSLIDDREDWVVETFYLPQPKISPYSDWGNIPMLNRGECEVVAWVYRDIPKPYKAESEVQE